MTHIIPIRDLKDTVKVLNLVQNNKEPVFITKNGYGVMVIMDLNLYEKINKNLIISEKRENIYKASKVK